MNIIENKCLWALQCECEECYTDCPFYDPAEDLEVENLILREEFDKEWWEYTAEEWEDEL